MIIKEKKKHVFFILSSGLKEYRLLINRLQISSNLEKNVQGILLVIIIVTHFGPKQLFIFLK
jgi:hypothetical protein